MEQDGTKVSKEINKHMVQTKRRMPMQRMA